MPLAVHHVELAGGSHAFGAAVMLSPEGFADLGESLRLLRGPNLYLAMADGSDTRPPRIVHAPGLAHLCVQSRADPEVRDAMKEAGVVPISSPVALGTGYRYSYAHDPAGRLLEVESAPFLPAAPPAWFGHFAFVSRDAAGLAGFYGALLDCAPAAGGRFHDNRRIDTVAGLSGVDVSVWWVRALGFTLEFWQYQAPAYDGPPVDGGYRAVGFESDDLDAAIAAALAGGAALERRGAGADGRAALLRDPDGNRFRLIELAPGGPGTDSLPHRDVVGRRVDAD